MQLLILGGTIFLGRHLVDAAVARGHTVTLFNRGQHNPELYPDVEKLRGNRDGDLAALRGRQWDAVIDTCGYVQSIDARDLAEWTVRMVEARGTGVYNATGPDYVLTMGEVLDTCRDVSGSGARFVWASEEFLHEAGVAPWSELPLWVPEREENA